MDEASPRKIGPYQVSRKLGSGGMGEVFLAWDERLERQVAIKRLRSDRPMSTERRRRFRREARAAARLSHPAIVQVHDLLEDADGDSIVMEYVEGSSLAELLAAGSVDVATALRYATRIAEGLAKAHERGFVHRDLKAENVMVTPEGEVKILDFGLAKDLDREIDASLTRDGAILGTVRAMSPEQAGGGAVDPRTDLYALGVLLYEMTTGRSPFSGENALQIHRKILTERPPPPRALRPELPDELSRLIESLLEKDPAHRPRSAGEVVVALEALQDLPQIDRLGPPAGGRWRPLASDAPTLASAAPGTEHRPSLPTSGSYAAGGGRRRLGLAAVVLGAALVAWLAWDRPQRTGEVALPPTPYELYQTGQRYLDRFDRQGYVEQAIEHFEGAIAADPDYAPAYSALGRAYWRRWIASPDPLWLDRAYDNVRLAVELAPQLSHAQVTLASIQTSRGEHEAARRLLEDLRQLDPENAEVYRALADLAIAEGDDAEGGDAEALRLLRRAVELDPDSWYLHSSLGRRLQLNGDYPAAAAAFEKSLELAPDNAYTLLSLAAIYHFEGRFGEAVSALQKSLEIRPAAQAYSNLGTLYFFQGRYRDAAAAFEEAVRLGANRYLFWANLGDAYRMIPGRETEAADAFAQAIQLVGEQLREQPANADLRSRLALYLARRGDTARSLAEIEKLGPLDARNAHVAHRSALVFELGGDRDRALAALEQALELGYSLPEIRREPDLVQLREDVRYRQLALRFSPTDPSPVRRLR